MSWRRALFSWRILWASRRARQAAGLLWLWHAVAAIAGVPASMVMPSSPAATVAVVIVALVIVVFIVCGVWEAFASDIHTIGEESIATPHPDGGFKLTITRSGDWMGSAQISTQISSGYGMDGLIKEFTITDASEQH